MHIQHDDWCKLTVKYNSLKNMIFPDYKQTRMNSVAILLIREPERLISKPMTPSALQRYALSHNKKSADSLAIFLKHQG